MPYFMHVYFRYMKPTRRPEPPEVISKEVTDVQRDTLSYREANQKDLIWQLARLKKKSDAEQLIPAWSGFNSILSEKNMHVAAIRYMPFLRASPTDFSTIYTILCNLVDVCDKIGQQHILVTADMAIYSKAQEILWNKPAYLNGRVTMRVGGMHTTMALLASLGKLFGDGGLLSLLTESSVYAEATARQMLQGTQFSRGIRGIKLVYEALFRTFFTSMIAWLRRSDRPLDTGVIEEKFLDLQHNCSVNDAEATINIAHELMDDHLKDVAELIDEFLVVGRKQSSTFAF